jgi:hypothetical protein
MNFMATIWPVDIDVLGTLVGVGGSVVLLACLATGRTDAVLGW